MPHRLRAGGGSYIELDYDGVAPNEYMNINGRIDKCTSLNIPFQRLAVDTVNCWTANIEPEYSMDVDGDGYLDVVCDLLGGGELAT